jgi:predicted outer membrane repeat protein
MRDKLLLVPILIITLALVTLHPWQTAQADTYEVTNTDNSGPGSLRQAITNANTHPGADTITFRASTNGLPIILTGTSGENANATGDLDILDGGDLIIQGNGAANTIIDGGGVDRVFHICPGGSCTNTVTFNGVAIQNGTVGGGGGGIRNEAGTTIIDGCILRTNTAINGGGISNFSTLTIQNRSVIGGSGAGNQAAGGNGGGIYNYAGTLTVNGTTISVNSASNNGGGIWSQATLNIMNGSTIGGSGVGNTAGNDGGGIHNYAGTTTIDSSNVQANSAINSGGGIWSQSTLNIQNGSTIGGVGAGNTANTYGGGIYNYSGTTTVDDSIVSANSAYYGGGIYNTAVLNVLNGSTVGGVGAGNSANFDGGGIYNWWGRAMVSSSIVSANSATRGGGIFNDAVLEVLYGSIIGGAGAGNTASDKGGGIYNNNQQMTVEGSRILNNTATSNGGGVYSEGTLAETSVTSSCIVGNSDISFYNNAPTQQIATGNWWGAPTGPNMPGADTVLGSVDVSGFLSSPILDCVPELLVSKSNDTGGIGTVGTPFHWTLTVANNGLISATFDVGQRILEDDLPSGPIYGTPVAGNFENITNSANIDCSLAGNKLTCGAPGGNVTLGAVTGTFDVTISVTPSAPVTLVNPAGICQVDPDGNVTESDESNNDCPLNVVNVTTYSTNLYLPLAIR